MAEEYIEREEALSAIKQAFEKGERPSLYIKSIPAADVAPVVHAKWDANGRCTNCGGHAPFYSMASTYHESPYCFECGAKMDKEGV